MSRARFQGRRFGRGACRGCSDAVFFAGFDFITLDVVPLSVRSRSHPVAKLGVVVGEVYCAFECCGHLVERAILENVNIVVGVVVIVEGAIVASGVAVNGFFTANHDIKASNVES
jgi:hypothetical protein